jgi:ubiquitin-conjugating enzyme E2 S
MTEIHAAIPSNLAKEVKEAQMRGEEKVGELTPKDPKPEGRGKGKERVKITPTASSKTQRVPLVEDEENTRRRAQTAEAESNDESDWIPGPNKPPRKEPGPKRENNIFGIRGLESSVSLEDATKSVLPVDSQTGGLVAPQLENTDPFTTVTSKRTIYPQSSFVIPISPKLTTSQQDQPSSDTPELLKFSHQNPFTVIQPNNQTHPLLKEFSYTWMDSEILHKTGLMKDGESRDGVRKRLAGEDFEKQREWEMKRFKKARCNLKRYNRGDFGPRTGIGRL